MSANNVRDAVKLLLAAGVVRVVRVRRRKHPHYELVDECRDFPRLLGQVPRAIASSAFLPGFPLN